MPVVQGDAGVATTRTNIARFPFPHRRGKHWPVSSPTSQLAENTFTDAAAQPAPSVGEPLPVAVVGCGRMGRLHARVYSEMPTVRLVGVVDANPEAAQSAAEDFGCRVFASVEELLPEVRAVSLAVPTEFHAAVAEPLLAR